MVEVNLKNHGNVHRNYQRHKKRYTDITNRSVVGKVFTLCAAVPGLILIEIFFKFFLWFYYLLYAQILIAITLCFVEMQVNSFFLEL